MVGRVVFLWTLGDVRSVAIFGTIPNPIRIPYGKYMEKVGHWSPLSREQRVPSLPRIYVVKCGACAAYWEGAGRKSLPFLITGAERASGPVRRSTQGSRGR